MRRLYHDGYPLRLQHRFDDVRDLCCQALLNLQALRIGVDDAGQLRNADDAAARQVADMREADDRGEVMFAEGLERNVAKSYDLVVAADLFECEPEHFFRVLAIAPEPFLIGARYAGGRVAQAFPARIVARPPEHGPDRLLSLSLRRFELVDLGQGVLLS